MSWADVPITKQSNEAIVRKVILNSLRLSVFFILPSDVFINSSVKKSYSELKIHRFGDLLDITTGH